MSAAAPLTLLKVEGLVKHFPVQKSVFDKLVLRDGREAKAKVRLEPLRR